MTISVYFEELLKSYEAEIDDLKFDSDGKNVLAKRLAEKRRQFNDLLAMIDYAPEMVAPVFHGAVTILEPRTLALLAETEPELFPEWQSISTAVEFEPWAQTLSMQVLSETGGPQFLLTAVCLEFLYMQSDKSLSRNHSNSQEVGEKSDETDADDIDLDLDQAGADWLSEQGFDRRD